MTVRFALRLAGLVFVCGCIGVFVLWKVLDITERNRTAIQVSCQLLVNAILETGADTAGTDELTMHYIGVIQSLQTPAQRADEERILKNRTPRMGATIPDCERAANHPNSVKPALP